MKGYFYILVCTLAFSGCDFQNEITNEEESPHNNLSLKIPDRTINAIDLTYNNKKSEWSFNDKLYSGTVFFTNVNGDTLRKAGLLNGKTENETKDWYPNGELRSISNYHDGKLHGVFKTWSEDSTHILLSHYNYVNGKMHGEQIKWYPTGEIFQILHLNLGKEEGLQKAFRKNGVLYANYEAKEGRVFGLKKAALCFGLKDQKIQDEN